MAPKGGIKTLTNALVLTNEEADLLCRVLEGVKTKTFEESNITLDDMGGLKALVANFKQAEKLEPEKEAC
ncbi:MAG: hypothetical protein ACXVIT_11945 [Halobacteriota archaeon]